MATCVKCKKNVGCGCQLLNGLCSTCRITPIVPIPPKPKNNVNNTSTND